MISYANMVTEVTARLGGRTDLASRIGRWLNYAYAELLLNPRFSFHELDLVATFNTVIGQKDYFLPDYGLTNVNFWFILNLRDNTNELHLTKTHYQVIDRIQQVAGRPNRYYRFNNSITLDPIPDGVYLMQLRYRSRPPELTGGTGFSELGFEWEEPLVVLSTVKGWEALDNRDKAAEQRQLLEPMLQSRQDVPQLEDGVDGEVTIEPVVNEFRW